MHLSRGLPLAARDSTRERARNYLARQAESFTVAIHHIMAYSDQPGGPYPSRDMREPGESQYPPPPGEEDDRSRAYHQRGLSSSVTLPSISPYDPQFAVPNGYPQGSRVSRSDAYRDTPQAYGRDERDNYQADYGRSASQHIAFTQSAPRQRTAIACRYCRRRKVRILTPV